MNRYTNLSFSSLNDLPQLSLPFNELDSLLSNQQSKVDLFNSSANLVPKYIQQSESDRNLAGQIMQYQQDVKTKLAELASTGNVNNYLQGLHESQNQIKRLYSPGGAADVLQQRYNQKEIRDKQLDEVFKANPKLATFYKQTTPYNNVDFNPQTGEYKPLNSFGNIKPHVDEKDINTWFNTNLDNIKDSLLQSGISKSKLDTITSLTDFWQMEGVSKDKLISVFTTLFPKEFEDSLYQEEQADKYFSGDTTPIDTNIFVKDDKGEYKLNINNPIGRRIEGYSTLGSRQILKHDRIKDQNEIALENIKQQNRKDLEDYKNKTLRFEGNSAAFNPNGRPDSTAKINEQVSSLDVKIDNLYKELDASTDPQHRKHVRSKIKWAEKSKEEYYDVLNRAEDAVGQNKDLQQFREKHGLDKVPYEILNILENDPGTFSSFEKTNKFHYAVRDYAALNTPNWESLSVPEQAKITESFKKVARQYSELSEEKNEQVDEWLKNNADTFETSLDVISLNEKEQKAILNTVNTNNWTFFNEEGPIENVENTELFGTEDKPIISDNIQVESISKAPFGEFGHMVTFSDKNTGKIYYGSPHSSNLGQVIGKNIVETADPNSDQFIIGAMMSNPELSNTLSQMTNMATNDTRTIVSGDNTVGSVKKLELPSGTMFELTPPSGIKISPTGEPVKFNDIFQLNMAINKIDNYLKSKPVQ